MHIPGTHLRGPDSQYNIGPAAELLPVGGEVIGFCSWREGLVPRPELADRISGVKDVAEGALRLVNRELGAEARSLLDRQLAGAGIEGSSSPGTTPARTGTCRWRRPSRQAWPMPGSRASRPPLPDLAFIPLAAERFDLVIPAGASQHPEVQLQAWAAIWTASQGLPSGGV